MKKPIWMRGEIFPTDLAPTISYWGLRWWHPAYWWYLLQRKGSPYLNWKRKSGYLPLGTRVRMTRWNDEGWIVAYQQVDFEPVFYYVSTEAPIWIPGMQAYTAVRADLEIIT